MSAELLRRLLAEAIGTAILVLFGAGSVVAARGAKLQEMSGALDVVSRPLS
jgi:glycerol uptake facilitator-like aquaporin